MNYARKINMLIEAETQVERARTQWEAIHVLYTQTKDLPVEQALWLAVNEAQKVLTKAIDELVNLKNELI